ncbi:hypothetical protein Bca4012_063229 [Brassica carinata]
MGIFDGELINNEVGVINARRSGDTQSDPVTETIASQDPAILEVGPEVTDKECEILQEQESATSVAPETESSLGRGQRVKKPSVRLNDYVTYKAVCNNSTSHVLTSDHSYSVFVDPVSVSLKTSKKPCPNPVAINLNMFSTFMWDKGAARGRVIQGPRESSVY